MEIYWCEITQTYADEKNWLEAVDTYIRTLETLPQARKYLIRNYWTDLARDLHAIGDCIIAKEFLGAAIALNEEGGAWFPIPSGGFGPAPGEFH
jgi:hypothetical protein